MENISHTLCGLALARACGPRLGPYGLAVTLLAANAPDFDIVVQAVGGRPAYLCHHRGVTHGLLGLVTQTLLLTGLFTALGRWLGKDVRPRGLLLGAALGSLSHLLLDALNTYGVRPWLPFDGSWYYGDVAFIVDPWLWLCFGAGAALGASPSRWGRRGWWFWNGIATGFLLVATSLRDLSLAVPLVWGCLMPVALVARERTIATPRRQVAALAGIGLAALYLLAMGTFSRVAVAQARQAAAQVLPEPARSWSSSPAPAVPWRFRVVVASDDALLPIRVDVLRGTVHVEQELLAPRRLDDAALQEWEGAPEVDAWRVFSRQPFVSRAQRRGQELLVLDDARYGWPGQRGWSSFALPLPRRP